jgi:arginine/lysine/ornithine decarboxylase
VIDIDTAPIESKVLLFEEGPGPGDTAPGRGARSMQREMQRREVLMGLPQGLAGRSTAHAVRPCPPGLRRQRSGENFGGAGSPQIRFLQTLGPWHARLPGFRHEVAGATALGAACHVPCLER